jgi:hypothetical protein
MSDDLPAAWLRALDERHLAQSNSTAPGRGGPGRLTPSEAARALRALSSCYVERRSKLANGGALESAGKRAAFALFYGPLHFLVTRAVVRAIPGAAAGVTALQDLGCGTGAAGAAWALECGQVRVAGIDRHPWAVAEANWTYRCLGISGRATCGNLSQATIVGGQGRAILAAYTVNELADQNREALLRRLLGAHDAGARVLIIEPIARRMSAWWDTWQQAFAEAGGRGAEWRFPIPLPDRQRLLGRAAGLDPRELTARSLWLR